MESAQIVQPILDGMEQPVSVFQAIIYNKNLVLHVELIQVGMELPVYV